MDIQILFKITASVSTDSVVCQTVIDVLHFDFTTSVLEDLSHGLCQDTHSMSNL